jgi:excisionase family DNA binding protein
MERLLRMSEAARLLGVHPHALRVWAQKGKIQSVRTPGGKRRIPESEVRRLQGQETGSQHTAGNAQWVGYARVSSQDQKTRGDLSRQIAYLRERLAQQGVSPVREVSDVASGFVAASPIDERR